MSKTIEFTEEAIKEYLDLCIRFWRKERDLAVKKIRRERARHYIDAFQSVRVSIFGELLPKEDINDDHHK